MEYILTNFQIWLCGGSVLVAPCSHVGHIFRMRRPYKSIPGRDSNLYNSLRTVKVWFDDYEKYFYEKRPEAKEMDAGDLSERLELKKKLNCKPIRWFIDEICPELQPKRTLHEDL
ncbi:unnamed protein product [Gongylonema pulchrum]|uniref:Glyco_transf_7C domain-containing protein n=1 Tax=Gongylonema pulchrum TaxID=637853 RepID=A0A183D4V0_9BILA|nr:unnamed protein product [Gongylonema pulchrum]